LPTASIIMLQTEPLAKPRHSGMLFAGLKRLRFERPQGCPKGEQGEQSIFFICK